MRRIAFLFAALCFAGCGSSSTKTRQPTDPPAAHSLAPSSESVAAEPTGPDLDLVGASAARAVKLYYSSLAEKDYESAWARMSSSRHATLGGYASWKSGYATTTSILVSSALPTAIDASHARVRITLRSVDEDACDRTVHQRFAGDVSLRRFDGRWQITSSSIAKTGGGTVGVEASSCGAQKARKSTPVSTSEAFASSSPATDNTDKVCYPAFDLAAVDLPAVTLPAVTLPATTINGHRYPAQHYPAQHYPAQHYPAQHYDGHCYAVATAFSPTKTSVLETGYEHLDSDYSSSLTSKYWSSSGSTASYPDPTATGFGSYNAAGFPKNQYVRPYVRRDGTVVSGYWRNSPSDGLPTCKIISC